MSDLHLRALEDALPRCFWLDRDERPAPAPALEGDAEADLVVVGAGFTGLWAALFALERDPGRDVLILEAQRIAEGASGRNGGFVDASISHGVMNGLHHFPDEMDAIQRRVGQTCGLCTDPRIPVIERAAVALMPYRRSLFRWGEVGLCLAGAHTPR